MSTHHFFVHLTGVRRVSRILFIMLLCFNQVGWTMEDNHQGEETPLLSVVEGYGREVRSPQNTVVTNVEIHILGDHDTSLKEQLDAETFSKLSEIEKSCRGWLRWVAADSLLQRLAYFSALRKQDLINDERKCSSPLWLSGGSFPIASERKRKWVLFVDGIRQGTEFVIFRTIHLGIIALAGYQIYNHFNQPSLLSCQSASSLKGSGFISFVENIDYHVLLGTFHEILGNQNRILSNLKYLLVVPFAWGIGKGLWNTRNSNLSTESIETLLEEIHRVTPGIWNDTIRWIIPLPLINYILPLHPIDKRLSLLMRNFLWNPNVSPEDLEKIWKCLEKLVIERSGYTPINALGQVMRIAYGFNRKDLNHFYRESQVEGISLEDGNSSNLGLSLEMRSITKDKAFSLLQSNFKKTREYLESTKKDRCCACFTTPYSKYLLWALGASTKKEELGFTVIKIVKLFIEAFIIRDIANAFIKAESCPKQPGVSVAGVEPWASDLSQECFEAVVKIFNVIPGQPIETLVGDLNQYYFPNCTINLDLSGKGLSGAAIANITRALLNHNITFSALNISGNSVNTPEDIEVLFPIIHSITSLDLSNNDIGRKTSLGTVALGKALSNLTQLTFLALSNNNIGNSDSNGTVALVQGLASLKTLSFLSLFNNYIDYTDSNGTVALAQELTNLVQLTFIDLSSNLLGYTNSKGVLALGQRLSALTNLVSLDLSNNWVGRTDSNGTVALGQGLATLTQLISLDLSHNEIGYADSNGTVAIGQRLAALTNLVSLDLSNNFIGHNGLESLINALYELHKLETFKFLPNPIINTDIIEINAALNHTLSMPLPTVIVSDDDARTFCQSLLPSVKGCNLSGRVPFPTPLTMGVLLECLQLQNQLASLDLSNNYIGKTDSNCTVALGQGLATLTQLTSLDLSYNAIGYTDSNGTVALGKGLSNLAQLISLDLSNNNIGRKDSDGTVSIGQGLANLRQLTSLDVSRNEIGYRSSDGMVAIGQGISNLAQLISLDLSNNDIGYNNSKGTIALGKGLAHLTQLLSLNLSKNEISYTDSNGTIEIAQGLANLTQLITLDFSDNWIGLTDTDGTMALSKAFNKTRSLQALSLGGNFIGSTGPEGPKVLIPVLLNLPNLSLENLSVQDMANISWTQASSYLQNRQSQTMMQACQSAQCHGGGISAGPSQEGSVYSFSSQQRYLLGNTTSLEPPFGPAVVDESRALVLYEPTVSTFVEPDTLSTLGTSAISGVIFAALPEAIGDTLQFSGLLSEKNAFHVKMATNAALVLATGSWMATGTSYLTTKSLQCAGVSESKARIGGNAAAFLVNMGVSVTPTKIAAVAVNYLAGRAGLWAEKGLIGWIFS